MMKQTSENNRPVSVVLRIVRVVIVLAIAVALMKTLIFLKKDPEKNEIVKTPPSVNVLVAMPESKVMTVEAYGTVKPRKPVKISVEVAGRILNLHPSFVEGGSFLKGDILVQIDPESYQLNRESGQVRINQATTDIANFKQEIENLNKDIVLSRANLDLAQKELDRVRALVKNQFASKNSLDQTEKLYLQAKMQLQTHSNRLLLADTVMEAKEAALAMARVEFQKADLALERTRIRALFNGFVLTKGVEKGEYVNPGQILGVVYQKGNLDVEVRIPLEKTRWLNGFFQTDTLPMVKIMMPNPNAKTAFVWNGQVARLKASIDEQTRTLPLTVEILDENKKADPVFDLKPGSFVKCSIVGETIDNVYVVPRYLLKPDDILFTVFENQLKMKKVIVLRKFEEEIYITGGLMPGDKIISSPLPGALDGMALSIKDNGQ
ncbi:MAG: HlyD family efflux transporter periplasmic adaptor subunit [Pseudomonadota bacterium]